MNSTRGLVVRGVTLGLILGLTSPCLAHSGGTDASGCHTDHTRGGRHCHSGGSDGELPPAFFLVTAGISSLAGGALTGLSIHQRQTGFESYSPYWAMASVLASEASIGIHAAANGDGWGAVHTGFTVLNAVILLFDVLVLAGAFDDAPPVQGPPAPVLFGPGSPGSGPTALPASVSLEQEWSNAPAPIGLAGFRFGMTAQQMRTVCEDSGREFRYEDSANMSCSGAPEDIGFEAPVYLGACEGSLCIVWAHADYREDEQLDLVMAFSDVGSRLRMRFGQGLGANQGLTASCRASELTLAQCILGGSAQVRRDWRFRAEPDQASHVRLGVSGRDGTATLSVIFLTTRGVRRMIEQNRNAPTHPQG